MVKIRLTRAGAKVGDTLSVCGPLGAARLGLQALREGRSEPMLTPFIEAFARPVARIAAGQKVSSVASSAIDVSDGLLGDLRHLLDASGVGAELQLTSLPTLPGHHEAAAG